MKKLLLITSCLVGVIVIGLSLNAYAQESTSIPNWVKSTAKFWVNGDVTDNDFEKGIQYLVQSKIIKISEIQQNSQSIQRIPPWVKSLAGLWVNGQATDDDFAKAIEYLVNVGIIIVNVQSNQTNVQNQTTPITPVTTINQTNSSTPLNSIISSNNLPTRSLIGSGINLKIINSTASGSLTLNEKQYNAPNLTIGINTNEITLSGQIQGSSSVFLQVTGIPTTGIEYNFNGVIMNGGNSIPVTFTALLTNPVGQSSPTSISNQNVTSTTVSKQALALPMLMLTTNNNQVYMAYVYNLVVKIFDPQSNPDKTFDQFFGGISDVNITATVIDPNNNILGQSIGKTDSQGTYQTGIVMPYTEYSQEQLQVKINATKEGYTPQFTTLPLFLIHPNSGGSHFCSISGSLPDGSTTSAYSQTLSTNNCTPALSWSIQSGVLPPSLTLDTSAGVISGTPTTTLIITPIITATTPSFVVKVTDSRSGIATLGFSITIDLPSGTHGVPGYSQTLSASGGTGTNTWSIQSGALPPGLTLDASAGVISGTPTTAGTYKFVAQVTDSTSEKASLQFSILVN